MKTSKKEVQLLLAVLGIIIAVLAYFFVYKDYMEKAEAIEAENVTLAAEASRLLNLQANQETYIAETEKMKSEMAAFESQFPSNILPEDSIMMIKHLEDSTRTEVANLSFGGNAEVVYAGTATDPAATATTDATATDQTASAVASPVVTNETTVYPDAHMYSVPLSISIGCTYDDFKGLIRYIYAQKDRMSVRGVNIAYSSENGALSGNMTMDTYYLTGTDKMYNSPDIPAMRMGVDTIFGDLVENIGETAEEGE